MKGRTIIKDTSCDAVSILLDRAQSTFFKVPELGKRYVVMAFELVKKNKVRLDESQKRQFCRKCKTPWIPQKTMKVIFNNSKNRFEAICTCGYKKLLRSK